MNGHPLPHRRQVGSPSPSSRRRLSLLPLLLVAVLAVLAAGALFLAGCGSDDSAEVTETTAAAEEAAFPVTVTDGTGAGVTIEAQPTKIVSTAPANTETLFALGLNDYIVGVTALDDYPPEAAEIEKVGDFMVNTEAVMALSPDLVVGYDLSQVDALAPVASAGAAVVIIPDPKTLEELYANLELVGTATGTQAEAAKLVEDLQAEVKAVTDLTAAATESPKVFYALDTTLWTTGSGTFVDELLTLANATNIGSMDAGEGMATEGYYQLTPEQLIAADPDLILLPNTAFAGVEDFTADARFADLRAVKDGKVILINDVIITRPGPRIGQGLKALAEAVHPEVF